VATLTSRRRGGILPRVTHGIPRTSHVFVFRQHGRRTPGPIAPRAIGDGDAIDRRQFLALGAMVAVGVAASACGHGDVRALGQPELLVALGPDAVRDVGRRYRESVPRESDAPELEAAIRASRPWTARIGLTHPPIADEVRDDFDAGRTVVVDGWLLSVTEARQCALYSALQS
jgi:hypothetical protein